MTRTTALGAVLLGAGLLGTIPGNTTLAHSNGAQEQRRSGAIRVQTALVSILVSVVDAKGEPVAGRAFDIVLTADFTQTVTEYSDG